MKCVDCITHRQNYCGSTILIERRRNYSKFNVNMQVNINN